MLAAFLGPKRSVAQKDLFIKMYLYFVFVTGGSVARLTFSNEKLQSCSAAESRVTAGASENELSPNFF